MHTICFINAHDLGVRTFGPQWGWKLLGAIWLAGSEHRWVVINLIDRFVGQWWHLLSLHARWVSELAKLNSPTNAEVFTNKWWVCVHSAICMICEYIVEASLKILFVKQLACIFEADCVHLWNRSYAFVNFYYKCSWKLYFVNPSVCICAFANEHVHFWKPLFEFIMILFCLHSSVLKCISFHILKA